MSVEPLTIADIDFAVARQIEHCPPKMMLRELVMNSIEAASKDKSGKGQVIIGAKEVIQCPGVRKLYIWNNGPGMNAFELRAICDLSSTLNKTVGFDGNFGIGAKVASLPSNKVGIRYRSCRNGEVSEVVLMKNPENGKYGKYIYTMADGSHDTVCDVTDVAECEGYNLSIEWTEVVLLGNSPEQDTSKAPYGVLEIEQWVPRKLYSRFYSIPSNVTVKLTGDVHTRGGNRRFEPISNRYANYTRHEAVSVPENGFKIHYFHDGFVKEESGQRLQSYSGALCHVKTFCTLIYKGEMYDYLEGKEWAFAAAQYGIPFGAKNLCVAIELPDNYEARPDSYRESIRYIKNMEIVETRHFSQIVMNNRPEWFIEIIENATPKAVSNEEIRKELQQLLNSCLLRSESPKIKKDGTDNVEYGNFGRGGGGRLKTKIPNPDPQPSSNKGLNFDVNGTKKSITSINKETAPEIIPLYEDEEIGEKNLKDKAAMYNEATNQLFVNMQYDAVGEARADLEARYASHPDQDMVREQAKNIAEQVITLLVGKSVVFAKIKKLRSSTWTQSQVEQAMSPESLSIAADGWMNIMSYYYSKMSQKFPKYVAAE